MFRRAVEEGVVNGETSLQIGLRGSTYEPEDYEANAALGFTTLMARDFDAAGVRGAIELALGTLRPPSTSPSTSTAWIRHSRRAPAPRRRAG